MSFIGTGSRSAAFISFIIVKTTSRRSQKISAPTRIEINRWKPKRKRLEPASLASKQKSWQCSSSDSDTNTFNCPTLSLMEKPQSVLTTITLDDENSAFLQHIKMLHFCRSAIKVLNLARFGATKKKNICIQMKKRTPHKKKAFYDLLWSSPATAVSGLGTCFGGKSCTHLRIRFWPRRRRQRRDRRHRGSADRCSRPEVAEGGGREDSGRRKRRMKKKKLGWRRFLDFWLRGSSCHRRWLRPLEADRDAGGGGVRWQRRRRRRRRWRWSVHDELVANYAKLFLVYLSCSFDQFQSVLRLYGAKWTCWSFEIGLERNQKKEKVTVKTLFLTMDH